MYVLLTLAGFAAGMAVIGRVLRRREHEGDFDALSPSSAARPGVRMFFDFPTKGGAATASTSAHQAASSRSAASGSGRAPA